MAQRTGARLRTLPVEPSATYPRPRVYRGHGGFARSAGAAVASLAATSFDPLVGALQPAVPGISAVRMAASRPSMQPCPGVATAGRSGRYSTLGDGEGGWPGATEHGGPGFPAEPPSPAKHQRPDVWIWHDSDEPITAGHVRSLG